MSLRAFIVLGPESSGTRLLTEILIAGGCIGSPAHRQPADEEWPAGDNVVWRRSVPHQFTVVDLSQMISRTRGKVTVVVCVRDIAAVAGSQIKKRQFAATMGECLATARFAYNHIHAEIERAGVAFDLGVYESLILHPKESQRALWKRLGLPGGEPVEIRDENRKHLVAAAL